MQTGLIPVPINKLVGYKLTASRRCKKQRNLTIWAAISSTTIDPAPQAPTMRMRTVAWRTSRDKYKPNKQLTSSFPARYSIDQEEGTPVNVDWLGPI